MRELIPVELGVQLLSYTPLQGVQHANDVCALGGWQFRQALLELVGVRGPWSIRNRVKPRCMLRKLDPDKETHLVTNTQTKQTPLQRRTISPH